MAEEKKEEGAAEGEAKPKSKKKLIIIVAVVLLLAGGGGAFAMMGKAKPANPDEALVEEEPKDEEKHYELIELDHFIVNLSDNASFVKIKMILEYDPEILAKYEGSHSHGGGGGEEGGGGHGGGGAGGGKEKEGMPGALGLREPMMFDAIIRVLSSKRAEEVLTPEGKDSLKEELIEAINEAIGLDEGPIVNIYFRDFIVQ